MGKQGKPRTYLRWMVLTFLAMACLVVFVLFGPRKVGKLEQYLAELEARGAVLGPQDLRSSRPMPETVSGESDAELDRPAEESAVAFFLSPEAAGEGSGVNPTEWPWFKATQLVTRLCNLSQKEQETIRRTVEENQPLIAKLKLVADLPPTPVEDILSLTGMETDPVSTKIPNLSASRSFIGLLMLDAYVALQDDRPDDAVERLQQTVKLANHVMDFPTIITGVMAPSLVEQSLLFLEMPCLQAAFQGDGIESFARILERSERREAFVRGNRRGTPFRPECLPQPLWPSRPW